MGHNEPLRKLAFDRDTSMPIANGSANGWEDRNFYVKWMGDDEPEVIESLKGPALNLSSPQSKLAPAVLELFQKVLLQDRGHIERVKRHHGIFRPAIDRKSGRGKRGQEATK